MENRHGLIVNAQASHATGTAERDVAIGMLLDLPDRKRRTVGADKGYDTKADFVYHCRANNITPHVARNDKCQGGSAIDGRTSRHKGDGISQRCRKRVGEPFGRGKTVGLNRQLKVRALARVNDVLMFTMMGWNLTRMDNLQRQWRVGVNDRFAALFLSSRSHRTG